MHTVFAEQEEVILFDIQHEDIVESSAAGSNLILPEDNHKGTRVTIRINEKDLQNIRRKAAEVGIPYQTLITALLHQYAKGDIRVSF